MLPGRKEFWRVANAPRIQSSICNYTYNEVVKPVEVVALDGVATGSQDGQAARIL